MDVYKDICPVSVLTSPPHCAKSSGKSRIFSRLRLQTFDPDMVAVRASTEVLYVFKSTDEQRRYEAIIQKATLLSEQSVNCTSTRIKHLNDQHTSTSRRSISVNHARRHIVDPVIKETSGGIFAHVIGSSPCQSKGQL